MYLVQIWYPMISMSLIPRLSCLVSFGVFSDFLTFFLSSDFLVIFSVVNEQSPSFSWQTRLFEAIEIMTSSGVCG
jgi:hypothetical protein